MKNEVIEMENTQVQPQAVVDISPMSLVSAAVNSGADVDMNIVMTGDGRFVELQGTAEEEPFGDEDMDAMRSLAKHGCVELTKLQLAARDAD